MMYFDTGDTPEEFWFNTLKKYQPKADTIGFPQNLCVVSFMKISNNDIAVYRGYLKNGDTIEKGQIFCIIEAMKIFNEIESEYSGVIKDILIEDGKPVEFGQDLLIISTE